MRTFHFTAPNFALALAALASLTSGCFGNDPLGLDGDWSNGERNNTQWQIGDGLCPGLAGGCALNVPLAVGVRMTLNVEGVHSATPTVNTPPNTTDVSIRGDAENQRATITFTATAPGSAHFVISDASGEVDSATLQVRVPTRIDCGVFARAEPRWDFNGISFAESVAVPLNTENSNSSDFSLGCRTTDATGAALLSADAIRWTLSSGTSVRLNDDNFDSSSVVGARVYFQTLALGTSEARVTFGDLTDTFAITVN